MNAAHTLLRSTRPFARASRRSALWQLGSTLALYAATLAGMFYLVTRTGVPYVVTLALSFVAATAYMRLFMFGHDASHGAFLPTPIENTIAGNLVGVLTNTPFAYWGRQHALHHQGNGNLDKRGDGDVAMMTLDEYRSASPMARLGYRLLRNPFFLFGIAAPIHFVVLQRFPLGRQSKTWSGWRSVLGTNLGIACFYGSLIYAFGLEAFLLVLVPVVWLSSAEAVWLFYVQHQFEGAYFARQADWRYEAAAFEGSSFYDLGPFLHWCTGHIGYHHIHHLNPKVPNYRLAKCHVSVPEVAQKARTLSLGEGLRTAQLALWDEERHDLISFREAAMREGAAAEHVAA